MIIILPLPDPALSPNKAFGRHWSHSSAKKKKAFAAAYYATLEARTLCPKLVLGDEIPLTITFILPDKRRRDRDNLLSASKATLDGIAKALGRDDNDFEPITIRRGYDKGNGRMVIEINPA